MKEGREIASKQLKSQHFQGELLGNVKSSQHTEGWNGSKWLLVTPEVWLSKAGPLLLQLCLGFVQLWCFSTCPTCKSLVAMLMWEFSTQSGCDLSAHRCSQTLLVLL